MSAKKHVIVPAGFTEAQAQSLSIELRGRLPLMSRQEAKALERQGRIQALGASGKIWQWTNALPAQPSWESGDGRVSKMIPFALQAFMAGEMRRRPSWCVTI